MLSYFRINDPYRLLGLFLVMFLVFLPGFIDPAPLTHLELRNILVGQKVAQGYSLYAHIIDDTAPLSAWIDGTIVFVFGDSLLIRRILAFLIFLLQGSYFGIILINRKAFTESTFIASLIFLLIGCFSFDIATLTGALLASGLMLIALNILFREIEFGRQRDENVLNVGILISLSSLLDFSFIVFVPGCFLILFLFTRINLRKHLLFLVGFLLPHVLLITVFYNSGTAGYLWKYFYVSNFHWSLHSLVSLKTLIFLSAIPLFYLLLSAMALNRSSRVTKYQSQLLQVMLLWLVISTVQILFSKEIQPQSFVMLIAPISFFVTHFLLLIRRRKYAEMNAWIIAIGIITIAQMGRYGKIDAIEYSNVFVRPSTGQPVGERILNLNGDEGIYLHNTPATGFVNWRLASPVFHHPEFIENISLVYGVMKNDLPDVILDPENLMPPFLQGVPVFKGQFEQSGPGVYRKKN